VAVNKDFGGAALPSPQIATAAERDRLVKYRARPEPVLAPAPKGIIRADLKRLGERTRENQIRQLNQSLYLASGVMHRDRLRAVNKGRAKVGFNTKAKGHMDSRER